MWCYIITKYNDRYNYLCSQFNGIEYAIKLEKYTNKLLKENTQLKQQLKDIEEYLESIKDMLNNNIIDKEKAIDLLFGDTIDEPTKLRMIANAGEVSMEEEPIVDEEETEEEM